MAPVFPPEEYDARQQRLRDALGKAGIDTCVITGPENICYLTGHATPGYYAYQALVFPGDGTPRLVMREAEVINAESLTYLDNTVGYADNDDPLATTAKVIGDNGGAGHLGIEERSWFLTPFQHRQLLAEVSPKQVSSVDDMVAGLRLVKSALEIEAIRIAAGITNRAAEAAVAAVEPGVRERDVAATMLDAMMREGSEYLGQEPYVASGPRSGSMHASWSDRPIEPGEPVLIELAAAHHRYHAALMHTVCLEPLSDKLRQLAETCHKARAATIAAMRPGATAEDCHRACVEAIREDGLIEYYRKRTGYSMGLAFPPDWGEGGILSLGYGQHERLRPGMVLHAVPAIRIPGEGGIGLSATVLVTEDEPEILTQVSNAHEH